MTQRIVTQDNAHSFGVLDASMAERRDTKFLQSSLTDAENVIMLPQGGYVDRGGSTHFGRLRRKLAGITVTAGLITAPNGGTIANLIDGDTATLFTTAAVSGDPFVVLTLTFAAPENVVAFDLSLFSVATASADDALEVQYFASAVWNTFGAKQNLRTIARTRRFARAPDDGAITADQWRVVVTGGAGPGAVSIGEIAVWSERANLSRPKSHMFNRTADEKFKMVISDCNIDIFRDGVFKAAVATPITQSMIKLLKPVKKDDSLLLFHIDLPPQQVLWQGEDDEWNIAAIVFENQPRHDFGDVVYVNGVTEQQQVQIGGFPAGDKFQLELEGDKTNGITVGANDTITAANVKAALEELVLVEAGLTVTLPGTLGRYDIEFTGGANADRDWLQMSGLALNAGGFVTVNTLVKGKRGGEDPMSATRGWPSVGRFVFGRLIMAGFKSLSNSYLASVVGQSFDLNIDLGGAAAAIFNQIDDDDLSAIHDIRVGRTLLFFTDSGVWHLRQQQFSAENAPDLLRSDAPGIEPHLPPLSVDNAIFYIQRGGQVLVQLVYSELEGNFVADNASVLSSFLIDDPQSWHLRRAVKDNDADLIMIADAAGRLVTISLMRSQDVSGFAPHRDSGPYIDLAIDADGVVWQVMLKDLSAAPQYVLERMDPGETIDGATVFSFGTPSSSLTGLNEYEGKQLYVWADNHFVGKFTVSAGVITLPYDISDARVGTWLPAMALDHPFVIDEESSRPEARRMRVFTVYLSVFDTTSIGIVVNGGNLFDVPIEFWDVTPMDSPRGERPYTGTLTLEGLPGFGATGQLLVTQAIPGKLKLRQAKKEIMA